VHRVLFASSEAAPLVKTGGLADVAGSLPIALRRLGHDVRLVLPAYPNARRRLGSAKTVARLHLPGTPGDVEIIEGLLPDSSVRTWLVHYAPAFDRAGHPYLDDDGTDWPDNAERFALFSRAVAQLATGGAGEAWNADVVHCNDWQTGLVPALLAPLAARPATVFTIHNLAYQGLFDASVFATLGLPAALWGLHGLEFHGKLALIKGGLVYADRLTTVSPTYASEIQTAELGAGLDGLLRFRAADLVGILNGADYSVWDPAVDPHLAAHYDLHRLDAKAANKAALQQEIKLAPRPDIPLIGMIGRLVSQKGVDLAMEALPPLLKAGKVQLALIGSGDHELESTVKELSKRFPHAVAAHIGYSEPLAHRIEAGADIFLMPSRFEPCGLNQIYSLRYGTIPVVRHTGGLADTVVDATSANMKAGQATGFVFAEASTAALAGAIDRALTAYATPAVWKSLLRNAMSRDFSWEQSARRYAELYDTLRPAARG